MSPLRRALAGRHRRALAASRRGDRLGSPRRHNARAREEPIAASERVAARRTRGRGRASVRPSREREGRTARKK
eukprot:31275-Pelagococcus_subviridis.AAC.5